MSMSCHKTDITQTPWGPDPHQSMQSGCKVSSSNPLPPPDVYTKTHNPTPALRGKQAISTSLLSESSHFYLCKGGPPCWLTTQPTENHPNPGLEHVELHSGGSALPEGKAWAGCLQKPLIVALGPGQETCHRGEVRERERSLGRLCSSCIRQMPRCRQGQETEARTYRGCQRKLRRLLFTPSGQRRVI